MKTARFALQEIGKAVESDGECVFIGSKINHLLQLQQLQRLASLCSLQPVSHAEYALLLQPMPVAQEATNQNQINTKESEISDKIHTKYKKGEHCRITYIPRSVVSYKNRRVREKCASSTKHIPG